MFDWEDFWRKKKEREILEIVDWISQSENVYLKKENLTILPLEFLEAFSKKEVYTLFSTPTGSPVYVNPSYTQATVNLQFVHSMHFPPPLKPSSSNPKTFVRKQFKLVTFKKKKKKETINHGTINVDDVSEKGRCLFRDIFETGEEFLLRNCCLAVFYEIFQFVLREERRIDRYMTRPVQ